MKSLQYLAAIWLSALALPALSHAPDNGQPPANQHPSGTATGGPVKPRLSEVPFSGPIEPSTYELFLQSSGSMGPVPGAKTDTDIYLPEFATKVLFWGPLWKDKQFAGDKISGLQQFYSAFDGSRYSELVTEYMGGKKGSPPPLVSTHYRGYQFDLHETAPTAPYNGPLYNDFNNAVTEICNEIRTGRLVPSKKYVNYFPIYTTRRRPDGDACSIHGFMVYGQDACMDDSRPEFSFYASLFYNVDNDPKCDVHDQVTGHSRGLAALANQAARAIAEVHTDPAFAGWEDADGNDIDDKCAWIFEVPFVRLSDGSQWKLQDLWSNAEYLGGTGFPNSEGQAGCLSEMPSKGK